MAMRKKSGGRRKGTPNKSTREIREILSGILSDEIVNIPGYLNEIDPEKRLHVIIKMLPYVIPTYSEEPIKETDISSFDFFNRLNDSVKQSYKD